MSDWNQRIIDEFRTHDGFVATNGFGKGLVLLHHRGARTGAERISPLAGIPQGDGSWLVAATKGGAPTNPAWFHNLLTHPDVEIETPDDGTVRVRATQLTGAERDAGWAQFTARSEGFRSYEQKTTRTIPVVRLARRDA